MTDDGQHVQPRRAHGRPRAAAPGRRSADRTGEHLASVLEATSDLVSTATQDGRILYFNRAARERFGVPDDADLSTLSVSDLHPEWAFRVLEDQAVPAALRDGEWRGESAIVDRHGRVVPVSQVVLAHRGAAGEVRFLSTIVRDISELKRLEDSLERRIEARTRELGQANAALREEVARRSAAQEELRRHNEIVTTIIDHSPVIMVLADPDGRFEFVSKALERLTGWTRDDLQNADILSCCYPDPEVRRRAEECIRKAEPGWFEFPMATRNGRELLISWANVRLSDGSQIGIGVDVTETKLVQDALETLNAELEHRNARLQAMALELTQAQEAERRRLAQLLHDNLQQLLTGAKFSLQASRRGADDVPELGASLDRIEGLMEEAIRVSRSLTLDLAPPALYESGLAAGLESLARQSRETHGLDVRLEISRDAEPSSEAIRVFLYQAVRELLFNAAKHARASQARVCLFPCGEELALTVEDDGVGFDPAQVADGSGDSGGFGLFSIRERIVPLGGSLEISSEPGCGSRFTLRAPLGTVAPGGAPQPSGTALPTAAASPLDAIATGDSSSTLRVLLADDHLVMRHGLAALLDQQPDVEIVAEADDGRQAVELARRLRPDVVVMDVNMPEMGGLEATAILTRELPTVRVVALSVYASRDMEQSMRAAGASAYLSKAGPAQNLLAAIRGENPRKID